MTRYYTLIFAFLTQLFVTVKIRLQIICLIHHVDAESNMFLNLDDDTNFHK